MKKIIFYYKSMNRFGGVERVIANTVNALSPFYDITILTKDSTLTNFYIESKVKIDTLHVMEENSKNRSIKNILRSRKNLKKYFLNHDFDYIYTATIIESLEVYLCGKKYTKKLVATEHGSFYASNAIYNKIKSIIFPKIHCLIAFTTMDTEQYKKLGYPVVYIPHLINNKYSDTVLEKEKIILNVGRLTHDKQQKLLIKMWKELCDENKINDWSLYIIGSGELKSELKKYIKDINAYNIKMIDATPKIEEYYKKGSIFAFTSKMEGFGMVLTEAMSYGNPCISFDCPSGPRDIIINGRNGFLIPCYNTEEYKKMLYELMNDKEKRYEMGVEAIKTIRNWNNDKIIMLFRKVFN